MMKRLLLPEQFGSLYVCPAGGTGQAQHDAAYSLLEACLPAYADARQTGLSGLPPISCAENGKPYFPNHPEIHFNLSHCNGLAACLLSPYPCGVDAEQRRPLRERVVRRVFTDSEQHILAGSDDPDFLFTRLWTLKEAYVKAIGQGISYPMKKLSFQLHENEVQSNIQNAKFFHFTENDFAVSVCLLTEE